MKYIGLFNYDADGALCAIMASRHYHPEKHFASGYGKLDFNIKKAIQYSKDRDIPGICIGDWSLTLDQYKVIEDHFEEIIHIDHHRTSREVYDYLGRGDELNTILCAGAQWAQHISKLGHRFSSADKLLIGATNAYDNWQTNNKNFQLGKDLTDLFYEINFWDYIRRFDTGYDGFFEHEVDFIEKTKATRNKVLAAGVYEEVGSDSLVAVISDGSAANDVTLYKPTYKKYFIISAARNTGTISMSVRSKCPEYKVGESLQELEKQLGSDEVGAAGGHDGAGGIGFTNNSFEYTLDLLEDYINRESA